MACLASRKVTQKKCQYHVFYMVRGCLCRGVIRKPGGLGLAFPWSGIAFMSSVQCGACCLATRRYTIFLSFPL